MENKLLTQLITTVAPLSEWDSLFALYDTSLEQEFYDWNCTLSDGLDD